MTRPRDLFSAAPARTAPVTDLRRDRRAGRRGATAALAAAAVVLLLSLLVVEVYDLDVWWQLAIGREIAATGSVPTVDRWSVLGAGRAYHDSHWLFQLLLWSAWSVAGWIGVQASVVFAWSAVFAALLGLARRRLAATPAILVALAATLACAERFLPRPEIVTYAAFAAFLFWFARGAITSRWQLARLGLVQAAWTNAHGLFVLGPFVALVHAATALAARGDRASALRRQGPALAVVTAATLVNPAGLGVWRYAARLVAEAGQGSGQVVGSLGEMGSPFAGAARLSPAIWIFYALLALGAAAVSRKLARRELDAGLLIAAITAALATTGRRNVVLFAIAAVPLVAGLVAAAAERRPLAVLRAPAASWLTAALLVGLAWSPLSGAYYLRLEIPARFGLGVTPSFFPHALAPRLATGELGSGLLVSNTLGGFVAFHGAPRTLPLTDGRWEIYDTAELERVFASTRGSGWRTALREHALAGVLVAHSSPEAAAIVPDIARDPRWRLAYLDAAASLWLPVESDGGRAGVDLADPALLASIRRPEDGILLSLFAARSGADQLEATVLESTLTFGAREAWLLERLGPLEIRLQRFDDAERTFERLLALDGENETALNELAFLAHRRADNARALALLERLLEVAPENEQYRQNWRQVKAAASPSTSPGAGDR